MKLQLRQTPLLAFALLASCFSQACSGGSAEPLGGGANDSADSTSALAAAGSPDRSARGLTLLSRGLPAYSGGAPAPAAVDASYDSVWRSSGVPATLDLDLSPIPPARRQRVLLAWYNDATYGYDHSLARQPGYNNPGSYRIEAHAAAGGGSPPSSGWVTLATVSRNTKTSLQHVLDLNGYQWLRMNFSASDGSAGNSDIALNLDLYEAPGRIDDGWFFAGDSITASCMRHNDPAFGPQVRADNPPPQENAGIPGWTAADMIGPLGGWIAAFPGRYVTLNLGTNDAAGTAPAQYYRNMAQLVETVLGAGKVPVVPTIPYAHSGTHKANIPALNRKLQELYAAYPRIVPGPDLYGYFKDHPELLAADGLHPSSQGCAAYRKLWAEMARGAVY